MKHFHNLLKFWSYDTYELLTTLLFVFPQNIVKIIILHKVPKVVLQHLLVDHILLYNLFALPE